MEPLTVLSDGRLMRRYGEQWLPVVYKGRQVRVDLCALERAQQPRRV